MSVKLNPVSFELKVLHFIHRALRGRYLLLLALGVIVGGICGYAAHQLFPPTFRSEGLVRIHYELPDVGDSSTDQNRPMTSFDTFMQSQKLLISSHRIVEQISADPEWVAHYSIPDLDTYLAQRLIVDVKPKSELIQIAVRDIDANRAAIAVSAIVNGYKKIYASQNKDEARVQVLQQRIDTLNTNIKSLTPNIEEGVKQFGGNPDELEESARAELTTIRSAIRDVQMAIALYAKDGSPPPSAEKDSKLPDTTTRPTALALMSAEDIGAVDPVMARKLEERDRAGAELSRLLLGGYGESHKDVMAARDALDRAEENISDYAKRFRRLHAASLVGGIGGISGQAITAGKSLADLQASLAKLQRLHEQADTERQRLDASIGKFTGEQQQLKDLISERDQKLRRLEQLNEQKQIGDRLEIISTGSIPLSPDDKSRHYAIVAAAGAAGGSIPALVVVLLSALRRRLDDSQELEGQFLLQHPAILGIIPDLKTTTQEQLEGAALTVHHIRVLLQTQDPGARKTYLVTSATSGEGKTSLTLSLALSFAAARQRTLVIDCDLVGRGISRLMDAAGSEGVHETMEQRKIRGLIHHKSGVYFLPAGQPSRCDASTFSASRFRAVLSWAQKYFDIVLIDSGPILGSVEATVAATLVDGVIMTVARGQSRGIVSDATAQLDAIGVKVDGVVFNRAARSDFFRSSFGSSSRSSSAPADQRLVVSPELMTHLGPLVGAVASALPVESN
jgi:Mrp family chromosome partitioning ATPase